jgi:hypothetical protein
MVSEEASFFKIITQLAPENGGFLIITAPLFGSCLGVRPLNPPQGDFYGMVPSSGKPAEEGAVRWINYFF